MARYIDPERDPQGARITDAITDIRSMLAHDTALMASLSASTPKVLDGHSDGKRVRYVKAETRAAVLAYLLDILDGVA